MEYLFITLNSRINRTSDYASHFHLYRLEWLPDRLKFYIDDQVTNEIVPPTGGFWELGKFQGLKNPWDSIGTRMAPFDAPVRSIYFYSILAATKTIKLVFL